MNMNMTYIEFNFKPFFLFFLLFLAPHHIQCKDDLRFNFPYTGFPSSTVDSAKGGNRIFKFLGSQAPKGGLQVTIESQGGDITYDYGRVLYRKPFKLWNKNKLMIGSFSTRFVFGITPVTNPGGEGLAFILAKTLDYIPNKSYGQWLGIVNATTDGSSSSDPIVAVEFDTRKSYPEDLDDNHVGVDINTIYSANKTSLTGYGINISTGANVTAVINYNGTLKWLKVFVCNGNEASRPYKSDEAIISMYLDLSDYLPEKVYVGFSASTSNYTQLNCVRAWSFDGKDVHGPKVPIWVWLPCSISSGILICILAWFVFWRIKKGRIQDQEDVFHMGKEIDISKIGPKKYKLKELKSATCNFNDQRELGRGGFGIVYKGNLDGEEVAVKRILENNQQGRKNMIVEVTTIGNLHHKNIVKLTGWCHEKNELLLVYEYMPNGSLDNLLYPNRSKQPHTITLSWKRRYHIVCGVAESLDYLHNECSQRVLHRDIKTSNIMLDAEFNACLGDFGLARMFKLNEKTHHTTYEIAGTRAYMAPEIFLTGQATTHTDVYAFGVLILEVICGKRPWIQTPNGESSYNIVDWVWESYKMGMDCDVVDPHLRKSYDMDEAEQVLVLGLACCHPNPYMRPSIRRSLQILMAEAVPPELPFEKPIFYWPAAAPDTFTEDDQDPLFNGGILSSFSSLNGR